MPFFRYIHIYKRALLLSVLILITTFAHYAKADVLENGAEGRVSLNELIEVGLKNNPAITAKRLAWKAKVERYPQARALEDPVLAYTEPISEVETRLGPNQRSIMLSQKLPFPGKRRLKGEIVNKEVENS